MTLTRPLLLLLFRGLLWSHFFYILVVVHIYIPRACGSRTKASTKATISIKCKSNNLHCNLDLNCLICCQVAFRVIYYIEVNHVHRSAVGVLTAQGQLLHFHNSHLVLEVCSGDVESARQQRRWRVSSRHSVDRLDPTAFCWGGSANTAALCLGLPIPASISTTAAHAAEEEFLKSI